MSLSLYSIPPNSRISFEMNASAMFGYRIENAVFGGVFNADIAMAMNIDIEAMHASAYASLPDGTPNDARQYDYFQIRLADGTTRVMGVPYVRDGSVKVSGGKTLVLTFTEITNEQFHRIKEALSSNGFSPSNAVFND